MRRFAGRKSAFDLGKRAHDYAEPTARQKRTKSGREKKLNQIFTRRENTICRCMKKKIFFSFLPFAMNPFNSALFSAPLFFAFPFRTKRFSLSNEHNRKMKWKRKKRRSNEELEEMKKSSSGYRMGNAEICSQLNLFIITPVASWSLSFQSISARVRLACLSLSLSVGEQFGWRNNYDVVC